MPFTETCSRNPQFRQKSSLSQMTREETQLLKRFPISEFSNEIPETRKGFGLLQKWKTRQILSSINPSLYSWGKWDPKIFSDLSKFTRLMSGQALPGVQTSWLLVYVVRKSDESKKLLKGKSIPSGSNWTSHHTLYQLKCNIGVIIAVL